MTPGKPVVYYSVRSADGRNCVHRHATVKGAERCLAQLQALDQKWGPTNIGRRVIKVTILDRNRVTVDYV